MPKKIEPLSALEVSRITKPGLYAVGGVAGLSLQVATGKSRSWILRGVVGKKRRYIGLGGYPDVSLAQARERARNTRDKIFQGIDVVLERQQAREALIATQSARLTFAEAAHRKHDAISREFRNPNHSREWISSLERYAFNVFGDMDVNDIELPHIVKALEPIWHTRTDTAKRVRQRIEAVLSWAIVAGHRRGDNPARWKGNLSVLLSSPAKIHKVKHFDALDWKDVPAFMVALRQREGTGARALEFAILTAARSGEVRGAKWQEIDLLAKTWTVESSRMKGGKDHVVPLSPRAIEIIKTQPRMYESEYIFASNQGNMISNMSLLAVCRRMEVPATPHGFRSSFKDWARNRTSFPDEVSELALAHVSSDSTRAAYARDALLPAREKLMDSWAQFCETPFDAGSVIGISAINHV
jgi:integrase